MPSAAHDPIATAVVPGLPTPAVSVPPDRSKPVDSRAGGRPVNPLTEYLTYRRLCRAARAAPETVRARQRARMRRVVQHAYNTVPFYRDRWNAAGVSPESIQTVEDLHRLPVIGKHELQEAGIEHRVSTRFREGDLLEERTSGTSGRPFTVRLDPAWIRVRRALFARALRAAGFHPLQRMVMLTDKPGNGGRTAGVARVPYDAPCAEIVSAIERVRPRLLYGWVTPLRRLAMYVLEHGRLRYAPRAVVTTAEALQATDRRLLETAFGAEVFEVYGLTELGIAAWECRAHAGLHWAEDLAVAEFLDAAGPDAPARLVLTHLACVATPFVRYDTGDLAVRGPTEPCVCGSRFPRLERIVGREVDCVRLRDGRVISPYRLTLAVERIPGLARYQVVQQSLDSFTVRYQPLPGADAPPTNAGLREAIRAVTGADVQVEVERHTDLDPPPGQKFRVVECRIASQPATPAV